MALRRIVSAAVAVAFATLAFAAVAFAQEAAQGSVVERKAKGQTGRDIRIAVFGSMKSDCTPGPLPTVRLKEPPANGTVTVKQARIRATNIKQCLAAEIPVFVALYRSSPGFTGQDSVVIEVRSPDGKTQLQRFTVTVDKVERPASGGQNI